MIRSYINEHIHIISKINEFQLTSIEDSASAILEAIQTHHRIYFIGNGGSAADCQHLAAEFSGQHHTNVPLPALALTTDTSVLTSISNDYSFNQVFVKQIEAFVQPLDIVIAISTSGKSQNVLNGVRRAKEIGARTITLTGKDGGEMAELSDVSILVPSSHTGHIQEAHIMIGHLIYELVCRGLQDE